jgi:dTMP kinase
MSRGLFVTFEGGEGAGKSTQVSRLREHLESLGRRVIQAREPGATAFGEALRELLLSSSKLSTRTEMLLFLSARSELVDKVIKPALESGIDVICDRFIDSTIAYQGYGRGLDVDLIHSLNLAIIDGCLPNLTLLLDIDPDIGLVRGANSAAGGDSIEGHWQAGLALIEAAETSGPIASDGRRVGGRDKRFHQRVRRGYLALAKAEPERILLLDATHAPDELATEIWSRVERLVEARN